MWYSGNENLLKWPGITGGDVDACTINVLCHDKGVKPGKTGYLQLIPSRNTVEEFAVAYEKRPGKEAQIIKEVTQDDLEDKVSSVRMEKVRARHIDITAP